MSFVFKLAGVLLFCLAATWLFNGLGSTGSQEIQDSVLDSPKVSGKMIAAILPAVFFAGLGAWCWQKPKSK